MTFGRRPRHAILGLALLKLALLSSAQPISAADCSDYELLLEDGLSEQVKEMLTEDSKNKACAYHLALALKDTQRDAAIEQINVARLFVNQERDPELFHRILYLKLDLDADNNLRHTGQEQAYDANTDYDQLKRENPEEHRELKNKKIQFYQTNVEPYEANPWGKECPETSKFWDDKLGKNTTRLKQICQQIDIYQKHRDEDSTTETRNQIETIARALRELKKLRIDISKHQEKYLEQAKYYEILKDDGKDLDTQQRHKMLQQAAQHLNTSELSGWDPESVKSRVKKFALMAQIEKGFAQNRFPPIKEVETWIDQAARLESGYNLQTQHSMTLKLAQVYNQCRKNKTCYQNLCKSDSCLAFVGDERLQSTEILGKELFDQALENVEKAIESKVSNATNNITRFFLEGDANTNPEQKIRASRLQGRLELLAKNYGAYTDNSNIAKLQGLAELDLLILNAPATFGDPEAVSWIEQLQALQEEDALESSYANSVKILRLYDQCRTTSGSPPTANDPCLQLVAHWNASSEIRRRSLVQKYQMGAERLLSEKSSKAVKDLVAKLEDQSPSKRKLKGINATVTLLNTYYLPYLEDEPAGGFQVARRQHPDVPDILSLTGFEEEPAPDTTAQNSEAKEEEIAQKTTDPVGQVERSSTPPEEIVSSVETPNAENSLGQVHAEETQSQQTLPQSGDIESQQHESQQHESQQYPGHQEMKQSELSGEAKADPCFQEGRYTVSCQFNKTTQKLEDLNSRLAADSPFFELALNTWRDETIIYKSEPLRERLASAIKKLKNSDLENMQDLGKSSERFSKIQISLREKQEEDPIPFIRNYFTALYWLRAQKVDEAKKSLKELALLELSQTQLDAVKALETAAAYMQWAKPGKASN